MSTSGKAAKVSINLNGDFSASEIEEIIRELAKARSGLLPSVAAQPPEEHGEVLVQSDTKVSLRTLANGGIRIWLRNDGIGWIAFSLSAQDREGLTEFLGQKIGHTHTSH